MGEFRILGPLRVCRGGQPLPVQAAKQRVLLACLLVRANHPVAVEKLIDHMWDDRAPANARGALQTYVARLRRSLSPDVIVSRAGAYLVAVANDELDLLRMRALDARARAAADAGDLEASADALQHAVGLWRGDPLADVPSARLQAEILPALQEERMQLVERRNDALLRLGRHDEVIAELTILTRDHPLRERFWAQRMRALFHSGRQGEALETYRTVATLLSEELGIDPGLELRELHRDILTGKAPVPPTPRQAVRTPVPRQLPPDSTAFVGRDGDVARIAGWLAEPTGGTVPSLVVISGPAGAGKTTLAVRTAHELSAAFPAGQLFVDLRAYSASPVLPAAQVLARFLRALGVPDDEVPLDEDEQVAAFRSLVFGRRLLIVLDNAADVTQVRRLLPGSGPCAVLVTSRNELTGLDVAPGGHRVVLSELPVGASRELLRRTIGPERVDTDLAAADELARMCGRLPLALRIAAANLRCRPSWRLADYLVELRAGEPVTALRVDGDAGSAVSSAFELSYRSLSAPQRRLFRLLGLVPGPEVTVPAAAVLSQCPDADAAAGLELLAASSLLQRTQPGRYRLHDLIRRYAAYRCEREEPAGERQAAIARLFDHYVAAVDAALVPAIAIFRLPRPAPTTRPFDDSEAALAWLDAERLNLVAAIRAAERVGLARTAWELVDALRGYWLLRGDTVEALALTELGLGAARRAGAAGAIAAMLNSRGTVRLLRNDVDEATVDLDAAMEAFRVLGWPGAAAAAANNLGSALMHVGDPASAVRYCRIAVQSHQRAGSWALARSAHENLALALGESGDLRQARQEVAAIISDPRLAEVPANLAVNGVINRDLGRLEEATRDLRIAIERARETGHRRLEASSRAELTLTLLVAGRDQEALAEARTAVTLASGTDQRTQTECRVVLADALRRTGQWRQARDHYGQALAELRGHRFPRAESSALLGLAELDRRDGRFDAALASARHALRIAQHGTLTLQRVRALVCLAASRRATGAFVPARARAQRAYRLATRCGYPLGVAEACRELGDIDFRAGDRDGALEHWRAAMAAYSRMGASGAVVVGSSYCAAWSRYIAAYSPSLAISSA